MKRDSEHEVIDPGDEMAVQGSRIRTLPGHPHFVPRNGVCQHSAGLVTGNRWEFIVLLILLHHPPICLGRKSSTRSTTQNLLFDHMLLPAILKQQKL